MESYYYYYYCYCCYTLPFTSHMMENDIIMMMMIIIILNKSGYLFPQFVSVSVCLSEYINRLIIIIGRTIIYAPTLQHFVRMGEGHIDHVNINTWCTCILGNISPSILDPRTGGHLFHRKMKTSLFCFVCKCSAIIHSFIHSFIHHLSVKCRKL